MAQIREFESTTESYFILDGVSYPKVYEAMYDDIRYSDTKIKLVPTNRDTNQLVFSTQYTNIRVDGDSFDTALEAISRLNQIVFSKGGGSGGGGTGIQSIQEGDNMTVDATDPLNPIVSATGGGNISDANYNAATNIITLTDTTGATSTVDLSELSIITNTDGNGVTTLNQEAVTKLTVSKVGQSGQYADLLGKPDPFVETDTLEDVTTRGNITSKKLRFLNTDTTYTTAGDLYFNNTTKNYSFGSLNQNATGINNIGIGYRNLSFLTTGVSNISFGRQSLELLTTGGSNVAIGSQSGSYLTIETRNAFVGYNSGLAIKGSNNSFFGALSGQSTKTGANTAAYNVGVGTSSLIAINEGTYNTASGYQSLYRLINGNYNVSSGAFSGFNFKSGTGNLFFGYNSGASCDTGNSNIYIGHNSASKKGNSAEVNSNRNIFIGRISGGGVYGENNVFIGTGAGFAPGTNLLNISNKLVIHNRNPYVGGDDSVPGETVNTENTLTGGLIIGDFSERWVKFNGRLIVNRNSLNDADFDNTYTKEVVAKEDGTFGVQNRKKEQFLTKPQFEALTVIDPNTNYFIEKGT